MTITYFTGSCGVAGAFPLDACREAAAPTAAEVGLLDLLEHVVGAHRAQGLGQGRVSAYGQVVVDVLRVNADVRAEDDAPLVLVEGDLRLVDDLFLGDRVGVDQAVYDLLAHYRLGDDLGYVLRLDLEVAYLVGPDDDDGASLAEAVAACLPYIDRGRKALLLHLFFELDCHFPAARGMAGGTRAEGDDGLLRVSLRDDSFSECFKFGG